MTSDRDNAICQMYLLWLYDNSDQNIFSTDFLELRIEMVDEFLITSAELGRCLEYLRAVGLLIAGSSRSEAVALPSLLTDDGIRCVWEYGGDVRTWICRDSPKCDQSVQVVSQGSAYVIAHSRQAAQTCMSGEGSSSESSEVERGLHELARLLVKVDGSLDKIFETRDKLGTAPPGINSNQDFMQRRVGKMVLSLIPKMTLLLHVDGNLMRYG